MTNMVKVWAWWSVLITMNVYALDDKCDMLLHTREQVASTHVSFQPYISWTQHVFYKLMRGPPPSPALQLLAHPHQATILSHACDVALAAILVILDPYTFGGLLWLMTYSECIVRIYLLKFSGDRVNMSQLEWFNYIICTITHWKKKGIYLRQSVITNPKSILDIRNDIRKVISETLTSDIWNILHFWHTNILCGKFSYPKGS